MPSTKLSSKYQIVIPKKIRESMDLRPGMEVDFIELDGIVAIVKVKALEELRGTLKGIDTSGLRDR